MVFGTMQPTGDLYKKIRSLEKLFPQFFSESLELG